MRYFKYFLSSLIVLTIVIGGALFWVFYGYKTSNPCNYQTIVNIPEPWAYKRVEAANSSFTYYLRSLPLKKRGSRVQLNTGGNANFQSLNYAVIDLPLISNAEQCADVCMRLRAEYLYQNGMFDKILFQDVNGKIVKYNGGHSRKSFEKYLRHLYGVASTYSLSREMKKRKLIDMQPGDVFVYPARYGQKYGHAVIVVDVAVNNDGKKAFLLAEGNTPAREIHVMRNFSNPFCSPWFILDEDADNIFLSVFHYKATDLKHF